MKPIIQLVERRPFLSRLCREDVAYLIEQAPHIRLTPTCDEGVYRLQSTRLVGCMDAPSCRIVIRPKWPLRSLAFLLDPDADLVAHKRAGEDNPLAGYLDILALRFTHRLAEQVLIGLPRGYREQESEGAYLQGRLNIVEQLRDLPRRDVIHSRYEEWTADVLCNRMLRAAVERLLASPLLEESIRQHVLPFLSFFEGVASVLPSPEDFVAATAAFPKLQRLLELAQTVVEGVSAGMRGEGAAFLLDLERLFERWVSRALVENGLKRGFTVTEQETIALPPLSLRPDLIVRAGTHVRVVVDAKWKRVRPGGLIPGDFYQAVAYAVTLRAERVVLVYPGKDDACWILPLPETSPRVEVRTVRVTATPAGNRRSLERLARSLLRFCR